MIELSPTNTELFREDQMQILLETIHTNAFPGEEKELDLAKHLCVSMPRIREWFSRARFVLYTDSSFIPKGGLI